MSRLLLLCLLGYLPVAVVAEEPFQAHRCELLPLPEHQVSLQIDGVEKTRWHFGDQYPRPFFYPFHGPSGVSLTRMGHPGASNHDHHRSVWFAHHDVQGNDFWSDDKGTRVQQGKWYAYHDGDREAVMAVTSEWYGASGEHLMDQDVVAALIPLERGEHLLEIQITMRPPTRLEKVELGKTNFGFLAVRVAKTLSAFFGGGALSNSEGLKGEAQIFGKRARWMDYSGPVVVGEGPGRKTIVEGITYFDHPENPRYPTPWHVREDGWMGASFCMHEGHTLSSKEPLRLRYLLHAHADGYNHKRAGALHHDFGGRGAFEIRQSTRRHHQFEVVRIK